MSIRDDIERFSVAVGAKHLLNLLDPYPFAVVRYEYHGSNDSMDNDGLLYYATIEAYDAGEPLDMKQGDNPLGHELYDAITAFGYGVTEVHHAGWENNEGGHGHVDFIVRPTLGPDGLGPRVVQNHWDYVQTEEHGGEHVY